MRVRKLTPTGDYSFGHGQKDFYANTPAAVGQSVQTRLLLWLGEWYLNTLEGTPYLQGVLGKYSLENADVVIQDRIRTTTGVVNISKYESNLDPVTRKMTVAATINTIYGPTQVQVTNYVNY